MIHFSSLCFASFAFSVPTRNADLEYSLHGQDVLNDALQLLHAGEMPRLCYEDMRKAFRLAPMESSVNGGFHGSAEDKVNMFRERFNLVHQRVRRHNAFRQTISTNSAQLDSASTPGIKITPIDSLLGEYGNRFLLGMLTQVEEGCYYLEDLTGKIPINMANIRCDGFVSENTIVLVEGAVIDGVFKPEKMGMPPYEVRHEAIDTVGLQTADIFSSIGNRSQFKLLKEQEEEAVDRQFVILSDVHLDVPLVMDKLKDLFEGFEHHSTLPVFVFMGNFTSRPVSHAKDGVKTVIDCFDALGNMIADDFPRIARKAKFIFVPGLTDPGGGTVYPRPPLPTIFTRVLSQKVSHFNCASNPCRVRFFTQELVFFRDDLVGKLQASSIADIEGSHDSLSHTAFKTCLDQGHLSPLPLVNNPIYWNYDHAMRLYPPPDVLVVGDCVEQSVVNYDGCQAMNPGSFSKEFGFIVFCPTDKEVSQSAIG